MGELNITTCTPWCTTKDLELAPGFSPNDQIDPTVYANMITLATRILDNFSAHQFPGTCTKIVRPARRNSYNNLLGYGWSSNFPNADAYGIGYMYEWGFCGCGAGEYESCNCQGVDSILLGGQPVISIGSVWVNGVQLATSTYRIDDFKYLTRIDGQNWPTTQDLSKDHSQANTFEVTFTYGHSIPADISAVAALFAVQLAKGYSGVACQLPERVSTVTRQGVTVAFVDLMQFFEKNKTGIYMVDQFLQSVNPSGHTRSTVLMSPDVGPSSRQVNT